MKKIISCIFVILVSFQLSAVISLAKTEEEKNYMVKFEHGLLKKDKNLKSELKKYGRIRAYLDNIDSAILTMNISNKNKLLNDQKKISSIKEDNLPNFKIDDTLPPIGWQHDISAMNTNNLWSQGYTGKGVTVAVLDTGVDPADSNLPNVTEYNCQSGDCIQETLDGYSYYHGTHVAGIIEAKKGSNGMVGVSPDVKIVGFDISDPSSPRDIDPKEEKAALNKIINMNTDQDKDNNINIINMSFGGLRAGTPEEEELFQKLTDLGVVLVASAGNPTESVGGNDPSKDTVEYPATDRNVIAVGSVASDLKREIEGYDKNGIPEWSAMGSELDFAAPGNDILSTVPLDMDPDSGLPDGYSIRSGTSMAAPMVSGMLALLKQAYHDATPQELKNMLIENVKDLSTLPDSTILDGKDNQYGYGLIQAKLPDRLSVNSQISYSQDTLGNFYAYPNTYAEVADNPVSTFTIPSGTTIKVTKAKGWLPTDGHYQWYQIDDNNPALASVNGKWFQPSDFTSIVEKDSGIKLNGSNQYGIANVNINPSSDGLPTMTFETKIKPKTTTNGYQIIWTSDAGGYNRTLQIASDGKLAVSTGDRIWEAVSVDANRWQDVAVTFTPDKIYLYKDGVRYECDTAPNPTIGTNYIQIGAQNNVGYGYFNGSIADMRIWNRELLPTEMNASNPTELGGLVDWWKLDEYSGTSGHNSISGQPDIDFKNNPTWNTPDPNAVILKGLQFDGSQNGQAQLNVTPSAATPLSFEGWIKPSSTGTYEFIWSTDNYNWNRGLMIAPDGNLTVQTGSGNWEAVSADMDKWQHVAVVFTQDNIYLYKNGVKYTYGSVPNKDAIGVPYVDIGYSHIQGLSYKGVMSDFRFWNKELQASELNQTITGTESGLMAWWKFNETSGITAKDSANSYDITFSKNGDWVTQ